jgi:hypothetical protein
MFKVHNLPLETPLNPSLSTYQKPKIRENASNQKEPAYQDPTHGRGPQSWSNLGIEHPGHNNSSLCLYGTDSATKFASGWKLDISQVNHCEDGLEEVGETDREYVSPKEKAKRELRNVNMVLRKSQFRNVDSSSLRETKDMVIYK